MTAENRYSIATANVLDKPTLKQAVLYACVKSPIEIRRELIQRLPIPKRLHNLQLV